MHLIYKCSIICYINNICGHNLVVECQLPKLVVWVRFPLPAPNKEKGRKSLFLFAINLILRFSDIMVPSITSGSWIQKCDIANANVIFTFAKMRVNFITYWVANNIIKQLK